MIAEFSSAALTEAWPTGKAPATFDRAGRVKLLGEFATATLAGVAQKMRQLCRSPRLVVDYWRMTLNSVPAHAR